MASIGYLVRRVLNMNMDNLRSKARAVSRDSCRPLPLVYLDIAWCGLRYQAGYMDYWLFRMWDMKAAQRKTVLTRGINNAYIKALNNVSAWNTFDNKPDFNRRFAAFLPRRWTLVTELSATELEDFCASLGDFIVKPADGTCGQSVERFRHGDIADWSAFSRQLISNKQVLVEEVIRQHPDMDRLWHGSVNTVRVVTIAVDGTPHIAATYLRVGSDASDRPVDNFNSGGMVMPVDRLTGVVTAVGVDKAGGVHVTHPSSGEPIVGFRIPMWESVLRFVTDAAQVVPEMRYVGWDVALTPDGPTLVEGNCYPGHDIYGLPPHAPDKVGVLPDWQAIYKP